MPRHIALVISLGLLGASPATGLAEPAPSDPVAAEAQSRAAADAKLRDLTAMALDILAKSGSGRPPQPGVATQASIGGEPNRLPDERQRELIAKALDRIEANDIPGAIREFDLELAAIDKAAGPRSLQAADLTASFAVQLYTAHHLGDAIPYFRQTLTAYGQAQGPDHPEVAVSEQDLSQMLVEAQPDDPPAEAVSLLEDAYRIRAQSLGMEHAETTVNLSLLGKLQGHPSLTHGDPAKVEAAADRIRLAIRLLEKCQNKMAWDLPDARYRLAEIYARNDEVVPALRAFDAFLKAGHGEYGGAVERMANLLATHHHEAAAKAVTRLRPLEAL